MPLPIATSRAVKLGGTVATVGFPNIGLQGFAPKLVKGEIGSLSGLRRAVVVCQRHSTRRSTGLKPAESIAAASSTQAGRTG